MGKKFMNTVLFLAVTVAAATLTAYVGKGSGNVLLYNFTFLGLMLIIYAVGLFAGLYRMDNLSRALKHGAGEITEVFQLPGRARKEEIGQLRGIFGDRYLDKKMDDFVDSISRTEEGIAEVEDFVNIEDVDVHIHKRLLEMAPDIFTSLGILGTFIGLVWGLKNFQPTDYEGWHQSCVSDLHLWSCTFCCVHIWDEKRIFCDVPGNAGFSGSFSRTGAPYCGE